MPDNNTNTAASIHALVAETSHELQKETSSLIKRQWRNLIFAVVISMGALALVILGTLSLIRAPANPQVFDSLEKSSQQLAQLTTKLSHNLINCTNANGKNDAACEEVQLAIKAYATTQQQAIDNLKEKDKQPTQEAYSLVQLLGGSALIAIIGYLGLMRLQNLDQELHNLRTFMFEQISSRMKELNESLKPEITASVTNELKESIAKSTLEIEAKQKEISKAVTASREEIEQISGETKKEISEIQNQLNETLAKYPWLEKPQLSKNLAQLDNLVSVDQAHELATALMQQEDTQSALAVLRTIVEKDLPGDKDDFHNAHSVAMHIKDVTLGLQIVDKGLRYFPADYDLLADKAQALRTMGRFEEAKRVIEEWKARNPEEFPRSWRPVVFYAQAVQDGALDDSNKQSLIDSFETVTLRAPHESKVWGAYASFLGSLERLEEAEKVLRKGIGFNSFSQQLHFQLGELLLRTGRAEEAVVELEAAVRCDYQDQFQSDVNQAATLCMLAQAYEANQQPEKAIPIYLAALKTGRGHIASYAKQRLDMLSLLHNVPIDIPDTEQEQLARFLAELKRRQAGSSGDE